MGLGGHGSGYPDLRVPTGVSVRRGGCSWIWVPMGVSIHGVDAHGFGCQ